MEVNLTPIIKDSFIQYSGAVLQSRALVDSRDLLKPSARQIFYSMWRNKYVHEKPYEKTNAPMGDAMKDFYIHEALTYIESNFQKNITIEEVAQVCNINRVYFGKIFKESLGKTPQEFILEYRMTKATELLKLTQMPIKEVGIAVGYENQFHFSRAFKNVYDISPYQWRKKHLKDM